MSAAYAALMAASLVTGVAVARLRQRPMPLGRGERLAVAVGALLGGTVGAKLPFLFQDPAALRTGAVWLENGRTVTWGLVGGYLGVEVAKWSMGITVKTGDSFAPAVAASIAVGRLGCWVAGCCGGRPSGVPWAVDRGDGVPRHPTQLYEFAFHLAMAALLVALERRGLLERQRIKLYIMSYLLFRFFTEWLREEPVVAWGLTFYQLSALAFLALFAWLWRRDRVPSP